MCHWVHAQQVRSESPSFPPLMSEELARSPAMPYSSDAQLPKSINRHRSEQNGRKGFPSQIVFLPHRGHLTSILKGE